jgi:hypothetical protein
MVLRSNIDGKASHTFDANATSRREIREKGKAQRRMDGHK